MELSAYSAIIDQLKPLVAEPDFDDMLARLTRAESPSARFLIKMELKRLASPCARVIDLRGRVKGNCYPFEHEGRVHYLDDLAMQSFKRSIKDYRGKYTTGVFEDVMNTENNFRVLHKKQQSQRLQELQSQSRKSAEDEALLLANRQIPYYPGKVVEFGRYIRRSEERMHYAIPIEISLPNGEMAEGNTTDLSVSGARIRVDGIVEIEVGDQLVIKLKRFETELSALTKGIQYEVMGKSDHVSGQTRLRLKRSTNDAVFDEALDRLISGNKRRYKVDLNHAVKAVLCKGYEQYFFPRMGALPVFCSGSDEQELIPELILVTENNRNIIHFWRDEDYRIQLNGMLTSARLNELRRSPQQPLVIYCFTHSARGKLFYYSAAEQEFSSEQQKQIFFGFGAAKPSWQVFQLNIAQIHPGHADLTTLRNGKDGPELDQQSPPPRVEARLKDIENVVFITNITSTIGIELYASNPWEPSQLNSLKHFGHQRGIASNIELHALNFSNLRRETRFAYKTEVLGKLGQKQFTGSTRDISSLGLQLELEQPVPCEIGDTIKLALPQMQKLTKKIRLEDLPYEIVGHNATNTVLHVKLKNELGSQNTRRFLSQIIEINKNKLAPVEPPEAIDGMSGALRNICAHAVTTTPFYVHKRGARYAIDTAATSEQQTPVCQLLRLLADPEQNSVINLYPLVKAEHFHEQLLMPLKKMTRQDPPLKLELYISIQRDSENKPIFAQSCYANEFSSDKTRRKYIQKSLAEGEFFAWQISLSRTGRPDVNFINDELNYISQYAIHKAKKLEFEIWDVVGVGEIIDITKEVLGRYPQNKH